MNSKVSQEVAIPYTEVLELRQKNLNANVVENGDYLVNLEEQIILNEGDSIGIKSVFLDTAVADSSLIQLTPNRIDSSGAIVDDPNGSTTTLRLSLGKYLTNIPTTFESTYYTNAAAIAANPAKPIIYSKKFSPDFLGVTNSVSEDTDICKHGADTQPYVMCEQRAATGTASTSFVEGIDFTLQKGGKGDVGDLINNALTITISYVAGGDTSANPEIKTGIISIIADQSAYPTAVNKFLALFNAQSGSITLTREIVDDEQYSPIFSSSTFKFGTPVNAAEGKQLSATITAQNAKFNTIYINGIFTAIAPAGTMTLDPVIEEVVITLPSGSYSSDEIARRVTQEASKVDGRGEIAAGETINSAVYSTIRQEIKRLNPNFAPAVGDTYAATHISRPIVFVKPYNYPTETSTKMFRLNTLKPTDLDYFVGSSNGFVLEYDPNAEKFSITGMHSPLRDVDASGSSKGAAQVRGYQHRVSDIDGDTAAVFSNNWANKYSGVFITKLEPDNIWSEQMKFPADLTTKLDSDLGTVLINNTKFLFNGGGMKLLDGINITGSFNGVSSVETKVVSVDDTPNPPLVAAGSGDFETPPTIPPAVDLALPVSYYPVNVSTGIPIFGGSQIDGSVQKSESEGYYRIEIDSKIRTEVIGGNSKTPSLSAIISKYYSQGSFTTSYNEGSVTYTHYGQPLTLTDFRVRVLLPNGELAHDISDRNCVFMQINKTRMLKQ